MPYENRMSSAVLDAHFEEGYKKDFVGTLGEVLEAEMDLSRASMLTKVAGSKSSTSPPSRRVRAAPSTRSSGSRSKTM